MISQKLYLAFFLEYLAINTGSSISTFSTYIVFVTEMQKGKSCEMDLPLFKNDITDSEPTVKMTDTLQKHAIQP